MFFGISKSSNILCDNRAVLGKYMHLLSEFLTVVIYYACRFVYILNNKIWNCLN